MNKRELIAIMTAIIYSGTKDRTLEHAMHEAEIIVQIAEDQIQ